MSVLQRLTFGAGNGQPLNMDRPPWIRQPRVFTDARVNTPEAALSIGAVFSCVRLISHAASMVPLLAYRGDNRAENSPLWMLVHDKPNEHMTAGEFWQLITAHMAGWGSAFAWKQRGASGKVVGLVAMHPDCVEMRWEQGECIYLYRVPGSSEQVVLPCSEVMHFRYWTLDGWNGVSPLGLARRELSAISSESDFRDALLRNGARLSGVLTTPGELSKEAAERVAAQWAAAHQGASKAGSVAVLEGGMNWLPMSASPKDLEFVQQRNASVADVARWYGVPPSLVNAPSNDSLTYSTTEGEAISFVRYCLGAYLGRIEDVVSNDPDLAPGDLRVEFLIDALLRADSLTRSQVYEIQKRIGALTADEIRKAENRPALTPEQKQELTPAPQPSAQGTEPQQQ